MRQRPQWHLRVGASSVAAASISTRTSARAAVAMRWLLGPPMISTRPSVPSQRRARRYCVLPGGEEATPVVRRPRSTGTGARPADGAHGVTHQHVEGDQHADRVARQADHRDRAPPRQPCGPPGCMGHRAEPRLGCAAVGPAQQVLHRFALAGRHAAGSEDQVGPAATASSRRAANSPSPSPATA